MRVEFFMYSVYYYIITLSITNKALFSRKVQYTFRLETRNEYIVNISLIEKDTRKRIVFDLTKSILHSVETT